MDHPDPGIEPSFPTLQADSLLSEPPGKPWISQSWKKPERIFSTMIQFYRSLTAYVCIANFGLCFHLQNLTWGILGRYNSKKVYLDFKWSLKNWDCSLVSKSTWNQVLLPSSPVLYRCVTLLGPEQYIHGSSAQGLDFNQSTSLSSGFASELSNFCKFNIPS